MADVVINPSDKEVLVDCRNAQFPIMHNTLWYAFTVNVDGEANSISIKLNGAKSLIFLSVVAIKSAGMGGSLDCLFDFDESNSEIVITTINSDNFMTYDIIGFNIFAVMRL